FAQDDIGSWYTQAMGVLEAALQEEGVTPPTGCALCGQGGSDMLAHCDDRLTFVHMSCLQTWKESEQQRLELKEQNSGHLRGVLGGLVGGIVGAVPALIALNFFNFYVSILFALIPLGIYFGWKILGGKLSKVTTVFTILYTLVVAFAVEFFDTWLIARSMIPDFMLLEVMDLYLDPDFFSEHLLIPLGTALVFSGIGIFCAWRMITKTDKHEMTEVQAAFDNATPLRELTTSK
ncbi:MAG: hypothetical protein FWD84_00450, partial [Oscillospiraceae bacterium]|nr:hypothetical protein [Oscillospiraceae bacterium]